MNLEYAKVRLVRHHRACEGEKDIATVSAKRGQPLFGELSFDRRMTHLGKPSA